MEFELIFTKNVRDPLKPLMMKVNETGKLGNITVEGIKVVQGTVYEQFSAFSAM